MDCTTFARGFEFGMEFIYVSCIVFLSLGVAFFFSLNVTSLFLVVHIVLLLFHRALDNSVVCFLVVCAIMLMFCCALKISIVCF